MVNSLSLNPTKRNQSPKGVILNWNFHIVSCDKFAPTTTTVKKSIFSYEFFEKSSMKSDERLMIE